MSDLPSIFFFIINFADFLEHYRNEKHQPCQGQHITVKCGFRTNPVEPRSSDQAGQCTM